MNIEPFYSLTFSSSLFLSCVFHWFKDANNDWKVENVIKVGSIGLENGSSMPSLISDLLISMDDKFIYFANWFHGDIRQYDISDPHNPKLVGQVWCGGLIGKQCILQVKEQLN